MSVKLRGVLTALVTPFRTDGSVDREALDRLVRRQLDAGINGLVPCGTTGETPALEDEEWELVVGRTVEIVNGRVPVVPGTGTNNTRHSVKRTQRARALGADAALVVTPYYNKPNPEGLVAHYTAIAEQGGLPVVVYNVPPRTGLNVLPDLALRLAGIPGIAAIKEASGTLAQAMAVLESRPDGFAVLSGEDDLACAMTLMGGDGVISVVSNVDPAGTVKMIDAALAGDAAAARAEHFRMLPLIRALFAETNPVPSKAALAELGLVADVVRPPLASASAATRTKVHDGLVRAGLL